MIDRLEAKAIGFECRRCRISVFSPPERAVQMANYCTACGLERLREFEDRCKERQSVIIDRPLTADSLFPAQRAKLEAALLDMDCTRERIRKMLEQT